jgi:hypothetical protein
VIVNYAQSKADDIIFKLKDSADKPVPGFVDMSTPTKEKGSSPWVTIVNLNTGEGRYKIAKCDPPGILFRAISYNLTYFLEFSEMRKPCFIGEIVFHFSRKAYASDLEQALGEQSPIIRAASNSAKNLQAEVVAALKVGNYPVATTNSMLLRDEIEKQFGQKAAEPFRILTIDIAASALPAAEPLVFDPPQKKYVLGPDTVREVVEFQRQEGLKSTGVLTWGTASKLPDISARAMGTE